MSDAGAAVERRHLRSDLVSGAIAPTMLKLGLPTILVLVVQTLVGVAETYFVSRLGTEPLAGVTLVFPVLMLFVTMANAGIGGGVSSAVARAIGRRDASAVAQLAWHAVVIAVILGALLTAAAWMFAEPLYRAMGGDGEALSSATAYSFAIFAGSIPLWLTAMLSAALRGAGDVRTPAAVTLVGAALALTVSPALIFGYGPLPSFGVVGAGASMALFYCIATVILIGRLVRPSSPLPLRMGKLDGALVADILGVGAPAAMGTAVSNLTVATVTGAVGMFGATALAGYGIGSRLDYLLVPILFGLGTAVVTMVGVALGAGDIGRARRVALVGVAMGGGFAGLVGVVVAINPLVWVGLFSENGAVRDVAVSYLRTVGPMYVFFGVGLMVFFASQAARSVQWTLLFSLGRLLVAGGVGWWAVANLAIRLDTLFLIVAASAVLFGVGNFLSFFFIPWPLSERNKPDDL